MSPAVEAMVAVGTLHRNKVGVIKGINLKFTRRMREDDVNDLIKTHRSLHKTMAYKVPENVTGEFVVINVMREVGSSTPATVIIVDEAGNVAGNDIGCGMNAWGAEMHTEALNAFIGREAFINMDAAYSYKQPKKVATVRIKQKMHVRDCRRVHA